MSRYTVSEIVDAICSADGLAQSETPRTYSQVRNAVRRNLLERGEVVDARGTLAFPTLEIYRARILGALADLSIDIAAFEGPFGKALSDFRGPFPGRCKTDSGSIIWRGLRDIVSGVALGEHWSLRFSRVRPLAGAARVAARVMWVDGPADDITADEQRALDESFGGTTAEVTLTLDLNGLFAGLPALENEF